MDKGYWMDEIDVDDPTACKPPFRAATAHLAASRQVNAMSAMASRYIDRPGCECCGLGVTTLVASIGLKVGNLPGIGVDAADVVQAIEGIEQLQALA